MRKDLQVLISQGRGPLLWSGVFSERMIGWDRDSPCRLCRWPTECWPRATGPPSRQWPRDSPQSSRWYLNRPQRRAASTPAPWSPGHTPGRWCQTGAQGRLRGGDITWQHLKPECYGCGRSVETEALELNCRPYVVSSLGAGSLSGLGVWLPAEGFWVWTPMSIVYLYLWDALLRYHCKTPWITLVTLRELMMDEQDLPDTNSTSNITHICTWWWDAWLDRTCTLFWPTRSFQISPVGLFLYSSVFKLQFQAPISKHMYPQPKSYHIYYCRIMA